MNKEQTKSSEFEIDNKFIGDYTKLYAQQKTVCAELDELKAKKKDKTVSSTLPSSYATIEKKPQNIDGYKKWFKQKFKEDISNRTENRYNSIKGIILDGFESSPLWIELSHNLKKYDEEYTVNTNGFKLLIPNFAPTLKTKPYDSFIQKSFRKNVVNNTNWPEEPNGGWILPNNWYEKTGDIVRTLFVVKYLDGIDFLIKKIKLICDQNGSKCNISLEAKDEGYYAAHVDIRQTFDLPKENWDSEKIDIFIEIQITTQLQEVIRKLLHTYYEDKRISSGKQSDAWKWDYKSDEFAANYVGHILHYMEGMIMDVRSRKNKLSFQSGNEFADENNSIPNLLESIKDDSI